MSHKILIEDVVYLVEKKLGINGVMACEYIYKELGKMHREFNSKYMSVAELVFFRDSFLKTVDLKKLNNLDHACFLRKTNELLENGSKNVTAVTNNKSTDPHIIFVSFVAK